MVQLLHVLAYAALVAVSYTAMDYNERRTSDELGDFDVRGTLALVAGIALLVFGAQFLLRRWDSFAEFVVGAVVAFAVVAWYRYTRRENSGSDV